jgi:hypothetical protein
MDFSKQLGITDSAFKSILSALEVTAPIEGDLSNYAAIVALKRKRGVSYRQAALEWAANSMIEAEVEAENLDAEIRAEAQATESVSRGETGMSLMNRDDLQMAHSISQLRATRIAEAAEDLLPAYLGQALTSSRVSERRSLIQGGVEQLFSSPLCLEAELIPLPESITPTTRLLLPSQAA